MRIAAAACVGSNLCLKEGGRRLSTLSFRDLVAGALILMTALMSAIRVHRSTSPVPLWPQVPGSAFL